ncbi:MAG TPA: alpha/beta hydrolase [Marmoricola sp.]|nr:alpha/beta hydrolase [Nocardioidaceae bacterium]MCB8993392.1 alpha/beta hydrolase [Nocardioidaceae bacterium]MCO5324804.1 alpha/beta hydrolase [Nocardioidaceae bacterium]HMY09010.1 alpha/beta hydrolase [Marmoricola sp.]HRV69273.1 alpha/beta hydrolase [Marmoricola sp.]
MSANSRIGYALGSVGAAAAAALATGAVVERRVARTRESSGVERLGGLRSEPIPVICDDGLLLHCEVDEIAPYKARSRSRKRDDITIVFAHGYSLNLDSWHYQRREFRGKYRMVFYDQRSHGRSPKSDRENANIDQLGDDMLSVINRVARKGKVILVGHSMGGMSVLAFAERHPEVFAKRVVGAALVATTAGDLKVHKILSKWIPDLLGTMVAPRLIKALASAPDLVDSARKSGSNIGYIVSDLFGYGDFANPAQIEFLNAMLDGTPMEVLAEFFPSFSALNKYDTLASFADKPTVVLCGTADRITDIRHSRRMAELIPGSRLVECPKAGHMVMIECQDDVNEAISWLVEQAGS